MFNFVVPTYAVVLGWMIGLPVGLAVRTFVFRAACALADVAEVRFLKALGVVCLAALVWLPLSLFVHYLFGNFAATAEARTAAAFWTANLVAFLLTWLISAGVYAPLLPVRFPRGLLVSGFEVVLSTLLAALVVGVLLVALAAVQIASRPAAT